MRPPRWRGIRVRITALAGAVMLVVLAATSLALLAAQRQHLTDSLDESLENAAADLVVAPRRQLDGPLSPTADDDAVVQVVDGGGVVLAATPNYTSQPALPAPPGDALRSLRTTGLLPGEPRYRMLSVRGDDRVVHVGAPLDDIDETVIALRNALLATIPLVAMLLAALTWWLVGRTLRPVEAIRAEVADISGEHLDRRVTEPATGDEVQRLAATMNAMLDRLQRSAESQRQFVADASHELRSPLTRIRSELEVDLAHPATAQPAATHRSILDETEQLQRLVEDLLVLARHDAAARRAPHDAVDIDDLVLREVGRLRATTTVDIHAGAVSAAQVAGDADELARAVRNLLDNAVRHARSRVTVELVERAGAALLSVADDGPGIPLADHERVFERFTRLDDARTRSDGGAGLGLAIVRAIVVRHGGTVTVDAASLAGARFVVTIPLMP
jgi:signal transduction histidine kinase